MVHAFHITDIDCFLEWTDIGLCFWFSRGIYGDN